MSYIQLPDSINKTVGKIQLNLPKDEKAKDLFAHLPYLANLKDPILQNRVGNLLKNREDLQKYSLATEDLNRTIEESLELAVSHGKLNDETKVRHVSERDNPTYNSFRKNDSPFDVAYKQLAKFDVQNPIIGSLLKEINRGRQTYEGIKKTLDKEPDPRALDLEERFNKIFERDNKKNDKGFIDRFFGNNRDNDSDGDDDGPPGSPAAPPPPPEVNNLLNELPLLEDPDPLIKPLRENYFPFRNRFEGRDYSLFDDHIDFKVETEYPEKINLDVNLREIFPEADQAFEPESEVYGNANSTGEKCLRSLNSFLEVNKT